jgi:hypothetical protein
MPNDHDPNNKKKMENEATDSSSGVKGSSADNIGGTATATGRAEQNQGTTGTAIQNPGTSRQEEDITGDPTERTSESQSSSDQPIRNPSGDDLSNAADGDEGSGKNI